MKVGLILYSVRRAMVKDTIETIEEVVKLGYKNLEVCNHNAAEDSGIGFGVSAEEVKAIFDKYGAKVISAHIFPFEKANLDEVFRYNNVLGNKNLVCPNGRFSTYDNIMKQCEFFNKVGKMCYESGFKFLYHNHSHEFRKINDKTIIDHLVENTDPKYLALELDTYWTMRAGLDPTEILKKYGKRIKLLHQKDFPFDSASPINILGFGDLNIKEGEAYGTDGDSMYARMKASGGVLQRPEQTEEERMKYLSAFTEIGTGIMRIQDIINKANEYTDSEYIILEQDATRLPSELESIKVSMDAFRKFTGISWDS
jgi:sugar phosphate isomerase/epimerase